ncbi:MAG: cell division protein FtsZ [Candidatus Colwellbacteria bacterium]|nr:cell division protein FtsZ [Candidatus Colwellbacteria bacterium]
MTKNKNKAKTASKKKVTKRKTVKKAASRPARKMFTPNREEASAPVVRIKVVGIGGGGGNAVTRMNHDFVRGVEFIALNTDIQDLEKSTVRHRINIGRNLTRGMGAGMNPDVGRQSAEESRSEIIEALQGADLVFLTAGMGGGTGTGATPVIAECAREVGALTVAVVTKPFAFEGTQRMRIADEGISRLRDRVDSLIVIPNDRVFSIIGNDTSVMKAFAKIDEVLKNTVQGISEIISSSGLVNVDFADIKAVMQGAGVTIVGVGSATGGDRAIKAATQAINSPLLERSIEGAKGVLFGISGGADLKMSEINEAAKIITENADQGARIIFGAYFDRRVAKGTLKINLIATGFNGLGVSGHRETTLFASPSSFKKPVSGNSLVGDDSAISKPRPFEADASKNEKMESLFSGETKKDFKETASVPPVVIKKEEQGEDEDKNDVWDIPAFLRRKKK